MSISTLSKITVPLDSNQSASNQGLLMPKLQYRFRVMLENFGVSTPTTELARNSRCNAAGRRAFGLTFALQVGHLKNLPTHRQTSGFAPPSRKLRAKEAF